MALPSPASRFEPAPEQSGAPGDDRASASAAARILARVKAILADRSENRLAQLVAGKVFLVRVFSALLALGSQVLLARWMGSFEYGVFIYVWTWVLMIGALSDMGLSSAARRFIPEYTELKAPELLRGFLSGSRQLAFVIATAIGALGAIVVSLLQPHLDSFEVVPLYLACATIPVYGLVQTQAGISQSYDWPNLALDAVLYLAATRPWSALMGAAWLFGAPTDAVTAMLVAVVTTWIVTLIQARVLDRRLDDKVDRRAEAIRPQDLARHLAADLHRRGLLSAAHLRRHSRARAFALAR